MLRMVAGDSASVSLRVSAREPDRLACLDVAFDHVAQDLAGTLIQLGDRGGLPLALRSVREDGPGGTDTMNGHGKM